MPSKAYANYCKNSQQVYKLIKVYDDTLEANKRRGKKGLDHLTRSGLMFLCSSWEVYVEQIAIEAGEIIAKRLRGPDGLPKEVKKKISKKIKESCNEIEPINFARNWKEYYCNLINVEMKALNTPKKEKICSIFHAYLGLDKNRIESDVLTISGINEIVVARGDIAHNVFADTYLKKEKLIRYFDTINKTIIDIELLFYNYIPEITGNAKRPWQNTYYN